MKKFNEWLVLREDLNDNSQINQRIKNTIQYLDNASEEIKIVTNAVQTTYDKNDTVSYLTSDWVPSLERAMGILNNDLQNFKRLASSVQTPPVQPPQTVNLGQSQTTPIPKLRTGT